MVQKRKKTGVQPIFHSLFDESPEENIFPSSSPTPLTPTSDFTPTWQRLQPQTTRSLVPSASIDMLAELNEPQRQAVTTTRGPVLILAGPGSGKTRVITHRIAYLTQHEQVDPHQILAVTFTNKAAREMGERVERLVGTSIARPIVISTFHSFCYRLLKHAQDFLLRYHLDSSFTVADEHAQEHALAQALKHFKMLDLAESEKKPAALKQRIAQAKNAMIRPDKLFAEAEQQRNKDKELFAKIYQRYDQELHLRFLLDFEDLLGFSVSLLRTDSKTRQYCQQRWQYLHVDEFQDCNLPQYTLIRLLAHGIEKHPQEGSGNICVVGDDDQMIYTWRGAGEKGIADFEREYAPVTTILLNQNYRSTSTIVETSQQVIRENPHRREKALWTQREPGEQVMVVTTHDEDKQALFVTETIQSLHSQGIISSWNEVAVLYRTNAQSRAIEEACLHAGLPYTLYGSTAFFERKEVKDFLAYVKVLANPQDAYSLLRIINCPPRGIGHKTVEAVQEWAEQRGYPLITALARIHECPSLSAHARRAITQFHTVFQRLREALTTLLLPELLDQLLQLTNFQTQFDLSEEEGRQRWENILELRQVVLQFAGLETPQAIEALLEHVSLLSSTEIPHKQEGKLVQEKVETKKDTITLLTLHASKGTEYRICFIMGLEEGLLPHARGEESLAQQQEERRLAYVGFTRAMDRLYLVRATQRNTFGKPTMSKPSRFLEDIPSHLQLKEHY